MGKSPNIWVEKYEKMKKPEKIKANVFDWLVGLHSLSWAKTCESYRNYKSSLSALEDLAWFLSPFLVHESKFLFAQPLKWLSETTALSNYAMGPVMYGCDLFHCPKGSRILLPLCLVRFTGCYVKQVVSHLCLYASPFSLHTYING